MVCNESGRASGGAGNLLERLLFVLDDLGEGSEGHGGRREGLRGGNS